MTEKKAKAVKRTKMVENFRIIFMGKTLLEKDARIVNELKKDKKLLV